MSPGPCDPAQAGIIVPLVRAAASAGVPVLGVCLGHQAIGEAFGGRIIRAPRILHGKVDDISHDGTGVFHGLPSPLRATRYHSLTVDHDTLPDCLRVTATAGDGTIMGLVHRHLPVGGRPVPPRKHPVRTRPRDDREFPAPLRRPAGERRMTSHPDNIRPLIGLAATRPLTGPEAEAAFSALFDGAATPAQIGGLLMAMRVRGETVGEIAAAARAMRARMNRITAPAGAMDIVGTGGDGKGTLNISTATAFVVAGAGVPVAKHGNRNLSSKSGSADALTHLGLNVLGAPDVSQRAIDACGICFMMAPMHHPSMRNVGPARTELGTRTIFNLLGPLTNPAGVTMQLTGTFAPEWVRPMAEVLGQLGSTSVWIVHGGDGTDELSIAAPSRVAQFKDGR